MKKEAIRVSTAIPVAPTTLYFAWLDSAQHTAMTGKTAKLEASVGSKYASGEGYISGKLLTLDLGRRIIMSWRTTDFPRDAHDSRVELHFEGLGSGTRVTVLHTEIPEGQGEKYRATWMDTYFSPMRNHFSKYLPDPRNPPVRRPPPPPIDSIDGEEEYEDDPSARPSRAKLAARAKLLAARAVKGPSVAKADPSRPSLPNGKSSAAKAQAAKPPQAKVSPPPQAKAPQAKATIAIAKAPAAAAKSVKVTKPAKPAKPAPKAAAKPAKKPAPKPAKPAKKPAPKAAKPVKKPAPKPANKPAPKAKGGKKR